MECADWLISHIDNKSGKATCVLSAGCLFLSENINVLSVMDKMKSAKCFILLLAAAAISVSCGSSFDSDRKKARLEHNKRMKEDSLALKFGTVPTLDCLPVFVAKELCLFDTAKADIRFRDFASNIDCDDNLRKGKIEGCVTDLVRGQRMKMQGVRLEYVTSTNAYWLLISNRTSRIKKLKQLNDKIVAMTRFSATAMLADCAVDSARLKYEDVFKVQINDVELRLKMLLNNEIDAIIATEPQATAARLYKNTVLTDSRKTGLRLGVMAFRGDVMNDSYRRKQLQVFMNGYNSACDSLNKYGLKKYYDIIHKYYKVDRKTVEALPNIAFDKPMAPRQKDIDAADKWLKAAVLL